MDYTTESQIKQVEYSEKCAVQECLLLPSALFGFHNTATTVEQTKSGRDVFVLYEHGDLPELRELKKDHFVYCNQAEYKRYMAELKD